MLLSQNTIEQKQEIGLIDSHLLNSDPPAWHRPLCAWCLSEQGIELGGGSHGICTRHASWLLQKYRERSPRRRQVN
jgi:hypothetical protein